MSKPWSDDEFAMLTLLHAAGVSVEQAAERLGRPVNAVMYRFRILNEGRLVKERAAVLRQMQLTFPMVRMQVDREHA